MATLKVKSLKSKKPKAVSISTARIEVLPSSVRQANHPLDKVFGIFQDEPLMDALMERVREDRRAECEAGTTE